MVLNDKIKDAGIFVFLNPDVAGKDLFLNRDFTSRIRQPWES